MKTPVYYSAEDVMKLCRMWADLHDTAKKTSVALGDAAYCAFVALENIAAHDYALVGQPTPTTITDAIAALKAAGINHSTQQE